MTSSTGLIDVNNTVSQLIELEKTKRLVPLQNTQKAQDAQLSTYGSLTSLLNSFQDNMTKLQNAFNSVAYQVSSSNTDNLTATITPSSGMYAGSHTINVSQLATAKSVSSNTAFGTGAANVDGSFTITKGGTDFTINVAATDTLTQIRDRINASSANNGVTASILATTATDGTTEQRLVLSSNNTGVANDFTLSGTAAAGLNLTNQLSAAQDAKFTFDNLSVVRSSNSVSDVLEGLNLTLSATGTTTINITAATSDRNTNVSKATTDLVTSYNKIIDFLDEKQATTGVRDSTIPVIKKRLQSAMDVIFQPSAPYRNLFDIGVSLSSYQDKVTASTGEKYVTNGQYTVNADKLSQAIAGNFAGFKDLFTNSSNGILTQLKSTIDDITGYDGAIAIRTNSINSQKSFLSKQIEDEQTRLDDMKASMTAQYTALNQIISQSQSTSAMLTQQISSMSTYR